MKIALPQPAHDGEMALEGAMTARRSIREFADEPLTDRQLSQLLWALQGITDREGCRTTPSAGALYPLEVYVVTAAGLDHYEPQKHRLVRRDGGDFRPGLCRAALAQEAILDAPATFVVAAVYERIERKYGRSRTPRYVHIEIGHAAQNLLLQAVALGLGAVPIGAFHDSQVHRLLGLPAEQKPVYLIPVGRPR